MNYRIKTIDAFKVAGIELREIDFSQCPKAWEQLMSTYTHEELSALGHGYPFGMNHDFQQCDKMNYMAAYDVIDVEKAEKMGLKVVAIEQADYLEVDLHGPVPQCIYDGWEFVHQELFNNQGFKHKGTPDFEVYYPGDMQGKDYEMKLWIPIEDNS